ncbi:MAG: Ig-like domain-containing protein, partial [Mobilitalea sp.]
MKITKAKSNLILISLTTLIFLLFSHQTAYADVSNFTYEANENGIIITGYYGTEADITIPGDINGQVVVGINMYAFYANQTITNLVIPESVIYIGDNAFSYCPNLRSVKFLGNAPTIGAQVFSNSSSEFKIYYDSNKIGFSNPWNGFITEAYTSEPEITPIPDPVLVTGITLDKSSVTLLPGDSISILPTINPSNAANQKIIWTSSNPEVLTVSEAGVISAITAGNAIITATTEDGGFTATCNVVVSNLTIPSGEFASAQNYDTVKVYWS